MLNFNGVNTDEFEAFFVHKNSLDWSADHHITSALKNAA